MAKVLIVQTFPLEVRMWMLQWHSWAALLSCLLSPAHAFKNLFWGKMTQLQGQGRFCLAESPALLPSPASLQVWEVSKNGEWLIHKNGKLKEASEKNSSTIQPQFPVTAEERCVLRQTFLTFKQIFGLKVGKILFYSKDMPILHHNCNCTYQMLP